VVDCAKEPRIRCQFFSDAIKKLLSSSRCRRSLLLVLASFALSRTLETPGERLASAIQITRVSDVFLRPKNKTNSKSTEPRRRRGRRARRRRRRRRRGSPRRNRRSPRRGRGRDRPHGAGPRPGPQPREDHDEVFDKVREGARPRDEGAADQVRRRGGFISFFPCFFSTSLPAAFRFPERFYSSSEPPSLPPLSPYFPSQRAHRSQ